MKKDDLGNRMKERYEDRTRFFLPRRTYTILRLDGKAFHSLTKGFERPFDKDLMAMMDRTAITLCEQIQGAALAYTQSDEISLILTDFTTPQTEAWMNSNIQKIVSISASIATMAFNKQMLTKGLDDYMTHQFTKGKYYNKSGEIKDAMFDSRVFTIPDRTEVINYLIWRQQDAVRNSIQAAAQSVYSQKQLHGKNTNELQEMLFQKGINWNDYKSGEKRGRAIIKEKYIVGIHNTGTIPTGSKDDPKSVERSRWVALTGTVERNETPTFTADREFLKSRIPLIGENDE
jgi:tRNA(His) guanylyltransferase